MGKSGLEKGIEDIRKPSWEKRSRRKQTRWALRHEVLEHQHVVCYWHKQIVTKQDWWKKQNYPFLLERILIKMMHLKWCISLECSFHLVRELRTHLEYFYFQFIPFLYGNYLIHCSFNGIQIILNNKVYFFCLISLHIHWSKEGGLSHKNRRLLIAGQLWQLGNHVLMLHKAAVNCLTEKKLFGVQMEI